MKSSNYLEVSVTSVAEALAVLLELRRQFFFSFRGQRDRNWPLGPHHIPPEWEDWERWQKVHKRNLPCTREDNKFLDEHDKAENEVFLSSKCVRQHIAENLIQFLRYVQSIDGPLYRGNATDWWNNLIVAHHYGFKSLLLDWTSNPLVALYFAVENVLSRRDDSVRGAVFALKVADHTVRLSSGRRWYDIHEVKERFPGGEGCHRWIMINPPFNSDRIMKQSGKFSYHPSIIDRNLVFESDGETECLIEQGEALVKIVIGSSGINPTFSIRKELGIMNVHHGSLFPDYDGFAKYINNEWRAIATQASLLHKQSALNVESPVLTKVREFVTQMAMA